MLDKSWLEPTHIQCQNLFFRGNFLHLGSLVSCLAFVPQGKLPDTSQPRVVSPRPGLPGRVSGPSVLGSRPNTTEDGPADPGETSLPLHRHTARRQGQVSLCLDRENERVHVYLFVWVRIRRETETGRRKQEKIEWNKFEKQIGNILSVAWCFSKAVCKKKTTICTGWIYILLLCFSSILPPFTAFFHFSLHHFLPSI